MKKIILLPVILLLAACTTTHYSRVEGDSRVEVDHFSMGMEREGIDLSLERDSKGMKVGVTVDRSSGNKSFEKAADALIEAAKALRSVRP
jgi:hypothetical protein